MTWEKNFGKTFLCRQNRIEGHLSFGLSVCDSVAKKKKKIESFTMAITFELLEN